ncbi:hypothetical protein Mapa_010566 [Marchantia paleacea]|nr:hypothetical protein Mapa_010566 [Marchantia paleacea]
MKAESSDLVLRVPESYKALSGFGQRKNTIHARHLLDTIDCWQQSESHLIIKHFNVLRRNKKDVLGLEVCMNKS